MTDWIYLLNCANHAIYDGRSQIFSRGHLRLHLIDALHIYCLVILNLILLKES